MKKLLQLLIGLIIGVGLLWLLFRNTDWGEVFHTIREVHLGWLLLAELMILATFFTRVQRWSYVVRTAKPVSFRHMFSATQIGFLANFCLPGRVGELIRALVLGRLARLPFAKCMAMVALDRINDLVSLVFVVLVAIFAYAPAGVVVIPEETFGHEITFAAERVKQGETAAFIGLIVSVGVLVLIYVNQRVALRTTEIVVGRVSKRMAARARDFLQHFAEGLHIFRSGTDMAKSVFFSLVTWALALMSITVFMWAFGIRVPWYAPFVIQLMLAVAISVPGAPGFVGQFHVPIVVGIVMLMPEVGVSKAKAVAITAHLMNLIPVYVVGIFCLFWERLGFLELTKESLHAETELDSQDLTG